LVILDHYFVVAPPRFLATHPRMRALRGLA
jgi:hypothetical protein